MDLNAEELKALDQVWAEIRDANRDEFRRRVAELAPEDQAEWEELMRKYGPGVTPHE